MFLTIAPKLPTQGNILAAVLTIIPQVHDLDVTTEDKDVRFKATIDDPTRFKRSRSVGAYIG